MGRFPAMMVSVFWDILWEGDLHRRHDHWGGMGGKMVGTFDI